MNAFVQFLQANLGVRVVLTTLKQSTSLLQKYSTDGSRHLALEEKSQ